MKKLGSGAIMKASGGLLGLVILLAILVAANVILRNVHLRKDLTEEKLYTLSEGTRSVLRDLDRDVTLKLFFSTGSPEVPVYLKSFMRQAEDLLHEYRVAAGRRITIETYDPEPDSEAEELAAFYEIPGQQLGMLGPTIYIGMAAVVSGEPPQTLPVLDPRNEALMEYNITRLIYRIAHPEKPVVGVMSSLPVLGSPEPPFAMPMQPPPQKQPAWLAFQSLQEDYDVREVDTATDSIDREIQTLIVVHPKDLAESTQYAIDQFLMRGGRLLLFVDPLSVADLRNANPQPYMQPTTFSELPRLFDAWGVRYNAREVVVDFRAASPVRAANNRVEQSPVWLSLIADNVSREDILTTQLESIMMPFAGSFVDETGDDIAVTPLVMTSPGAGTVATMSAQFGNNAIRREFKRSGSTRTLALRLAGTFSTAFPEGKPADESDEDAPDPTAEDAAEDDGAADAEHLTEGASAIILVGDIDMLSDEACVERLNFFGYSAHRPINDNLNFLANAVEQLTGGSDLIAIRSRGQFNRPFDRVIALQEKAMAQWQEREEALEQKLRDTQEQLRELESAKDQSQRFILTKQQKEAVARFRQEEKDTRGKLKEVRKSLNRDITQLGIKVKVINIAVMPLLVALSGLGYGLYRRHKH